MITDRISLIKSPDYDADGYYDFNLACTWVIKAARDSAIAYQVIKMEIGEKTTVCEGDLLRVSTFRQYSQTCHKRPLKRIQKKEFSRLRNT